MAAVITFFIFVGILVEIISGVLGGYIYGENKKSIRQGFLLGMVPIIGIVFLFFTKRKNITKSNK